MYGMKYKKCQTRTLSIVFLTSYETWPIVIFEDIFGFDIDRKFFFIHWLLF